MNRETHQVRTSRMVWETAELWRSVNGRQSRCCWRDGSGAGSYEQTELGHWKWGQGLEKAGQGEVMNKRVMETHRLDP